MTDNLQQVPALWRDSFRYFSDESLHHFARLYLRTNSSRHVAHSHELIVEQLWHCANRNEFQQASLTALNPLDVQLLLLLYLGLESAEELSQRLPNYTTIEICLQLLHLQERLLVLRIEEHQKSHNKHGTEGEPENPKNLENLQNLQNKGDQETPADSLFRTEFQRRHSLESHFVIAPQFAGPLRRHFDICAIFQGLRVQAPESPAQQSTPSFPPLLLSSELLLAAALFFAQENIPLQRKFSKAQQKKLSQCFCAHSTEQLQQLRLLCKQVGLLQETEGQVVFDQLAFAQLWQTPYRQRLLSLQALATQLPPDAFARMLGIWHSHIALPKSGLQDLLCTMGLAPNAVECVQALLNWHIICPLPDSWINEQPSVPKQEYYLLNPQIRRSVLEGDTDNSPQPSQNRLSPNWELYSDLRHPEHYIELLLCSQLEHFADLSLFHIEKECFQQHFNAESQRFADFEQNWPQLERWGLQISNFMAQQWREWFADSCRFQLFKNCLLVCQPSYNELVVHVLEGKLAAEILSNPQPGVFYLREGGAWQNALANAGIQFSEPFAARSAATQQPKKNTLLYFPLHLAMHSQEQHSQHPKGVPDQEQSKEQSKEQSQEATPAAQFSRSSPAAPFPWRNWPTDPVKFVRSRNLVPCRNGVPPLPIHFREARGLDYNAKCNLLHSLLTSRNHLAVIAVAEDDNSGQDFHLTSYMILPLVLEGSKDNPTLLALNLQAERLQRFRVKNITRVNEVFPSLINISILHLLPAVYLAQLERRYREE